MNSIRDLLTNDHRHCDELFVAVERAVGDKAWAAAATDFAAFKAAMLQHFTAEESLLFPAFEAHTGMTMGPTQVMRSEHAQMRELLAGAAVAIDAHDADEYLGCAETLLIMMQQHNMKEENVLYPMCEQRLASQMASLCKDVQAKLDARA